MARPSAETLQLSAAEEMQVQVIHRL